MLFIQEAGSFDNELPDYHRQLTPKIQLDQIVYLGPSFPFLFDHSSRKYVYIGKPAVEILGFAPQLYGIADLWYRVSLQERKLLQQVFSKVYGLVATVSRYDRNLIGFSVDYHYQTESHQYLRILQQTSHIIHDRKGNRVFEGGHCTDISHWGVDGHIHVRVFNKASGKIYIHQSFPIRDHTNPYTPSRRERDVIREASKGMKNHGIADALGISVHTVNKHRQNLTARLGLKTFTEVVALATKNGWI